MAFRWYSGIIRRVALGTVAFMMSAWGYGPFCTGLSRIVRFWIRGLPVLGSNTGTHTLLLHGVGLTGPRTTTLSRRRFRREEHNGSRLGKEAGGRWVHAGGGFRDGPKLLGLAQNCGIVIIPNELFRTMIIPKSCSVLFALVSSCTRRAASQDADADATRSLASLVYIFPTPPSWFFGYSQVFR